MTRLNPYEEGHLKAIAKILLLPLLRAKPKFRGLQDWLEHAFGVHNRIIKRFEVIKAFKLPGLFYISPSRTEDKQARGSRKLKVGDEIWVRLEKNKIDVEVNRKSIDTQIFCLYPQQFKKILWNLKDKPFRERRRIGASWLKPLK